MPHPRTPSLRLASALGLAGALFALPAFAANFDSAYTDLDLDQCTIINADDFGARFACPGYKGMPVMVAEGDLRFFVSFGLKSTEEPAAEQTLAPFNTLGGKIEWRLSDAPGRWMPIAAIQRWYTEMDDGDGIKQGQILIVTKIEEGNTCQIARIDALLTPNANQVARDIADSKAIGFDCADDDMQLIPD